MTSPLKIFLLPLSLLATPLAAQAQAWVDVAEYRGEERAPRQAYWDGNCHVEQRVSPDGELEERRRCRGDRRAYERAAARTEAEREARDYDDDARRSDTYREPRYADYGDRGRYADNGNQRRYAEPGEPRRHAEYRDQPRYAPAPLPAPRYRVEEPAGFMPRTTARVIPVAPTPVQVLPAPAPAKVILAPRAVVQAAPAAPSRSEKPAAKIPKRAAAPRALSKAAVAPGVAAKAKPAAPRLVIKAKPAPKALAVNRAPALKAAPKVVKVLESPSVTAKAAPAPRAVARATPVVKSPRNYPKSDWLVTLPPEEAAADTDGKTAAEAVVKAPPVAKAPVATAKAAPAAPSGTPSQVATTDPNWQGHEYREYVEAKAKDRYSNLR